MRELKQSTAANIMVFMTSSSDHVSGATSLTLTITISKDGSVFSSITPTVTERGNGWYVLALTTTHTNTLGDLAFHITASGADSSDFKNVIVANLEVDTFTQINTLIPSALIVNSGNVSSNVIQWNGTPVTGMPVPTGTPMSLSSTGLDSIIIETGVNPRQALSVIFAAAAGIISGANTNNITIKGGNVNTTRITAITDNSGNRTSVTLTLP